MKMPIRSQVLGWTAAGFDQSSLKALLQLFLSDLPSFFFCRSSVFHFFILSGFMSTKVEKKTHITKLSNQSLMAVLVIFYSLVHMQGQFEVTKIPLLQDQQECFYIVQPLLLTHPSFAGRMKE